MVLGFPTSVGAIYRFHFTPFIPGNISDACLNYVRSSPPNIPLLEAGWELVCDSAAVFRVLVMCAVRALLHVNHFKYMCLML